MRHEDRELEQRRVANEIEYEWLKRLPTTPHDAVLVARELREMFVRAAGNSFVKDAQALWEEQRVRQTWVTLIERWPHVAR